MPSQMLTVQLRPSRIALYLLGGALCAAIIAVGSAGLPGYLRFGLICMLLAFSGVRARGKRTPDRFRCRDDGLLDVWSGNGWEEASLCADTVVSHWLTVLRFRRSGAGGCETSVCFRDSLDDDAYRMFRVWLKWKGLCGVGRLDRPETVWQEGDGVSNRAR